MEQPQTINQNSSNVSESLRPNRKWVIVVCVVATFVLVLAAVVFLMQGNNSEVDDLTMPKVSLLPANTCPDSVTEKSGRVVAVLNNKELDMTQDTYNWVLDNCNFTGELPAPALSNLGIPLEGFDQYDVMTGRAGAFIFDRQALSNNTPVNKLLIEFGASITEEGNEKTFPEITYTQLDSDTNIISMADGTIFKINEQGDNDYSIEIRYNDSWMLIHDHVRDLQVEEGDTVSAGDVLGKVVLNRDGVTGFTEIQIKEAAGKTKSTSYCPVSLLSEDVMGVYESKIEALMSDWEEYYGDTSIHDESKNITKGCLVETITE